MNKTSQEIRCHNCEKYIQFEIDLDLNGRHEFECPNCGHMHYRIVENGEITDKRYDLDPSHYERRGMLHTARILSWTIDSLYYRGTHTCDWTTTHDYLRQRWFDRGTGGWY